MKHAIPDVATARRCIDALAEYLVTKDDSPRAAADLRESVRLLAAQPASGATCQTCAERTRETEDSIMVAIRADRKAIADFVVKESGHGSSVIAAAILKGEHLPPV